MEAKRKEVERMHALGAQLDDLTDALEALLDAEHAMRTLDADAMVKTRDYLEALAPPRSRHRAAG